MKVFKVEFSYLVDGSGTSISDEATVAAENAEEAIAIVKELGMKPEPYTDDDGKEQTCTYTDFDLVSVSKICTLTYAPSIANA